MRITTKMIYNQTVYNISNQYEQMYDLNEQVSSGKRINKPSDDPVDVGKTLDYRALLGSIDQYKKNIDRGTSFLRNIESALSSAEDIFTEAKVLAEQLATGSYNETQRNDLALQAEQLYDQLAQVANTKVVDQYVFSGFKTDTKPFTYDDNYNITYNGDQNLIRYEVQQDVKVSVNIPGQNAFMSDTNVFDVLRDLRTALRENDEDAIGEILPRIDEAKEQLSKGGSYIGTSLKTLEASQTILEDFSTNTEQLLSDTEDTDIVDAVTKLNERKLVYEASLKSSAVITQLTLVDFI